MIVLEKKTGKKNWFKGEEKEGEKTFENIPRHVMLGDKHVGNGRHLKRDTDPNMGFFKRTMSLLLYIHIKMVL